MMGITVRDITVFLKVLTYVVGIYFLQWLAYKVGLFSFYPKEDTLYGWDATWYRSVAEDGYLYWGGTQCNSGFFILFPALWRLLHTGVWGICITNIILFAAGFTLLVHTLKPGRLQQLLWLTLPPVYFAFVPYTEALSFLLSCICMYGIFKNRNVLIIVSVFLLSLTRFSVTFLVPSLVLMELVAGNRANWWRAVRKSLLVYVLPAVGGLAFFVWYQYSVTGVWFLYFKLQAQFWGHVFSWPSFPFITSNFSRTILLSAFATLCCLAAMVCLIYIFARWVYKNKPQPLRLLVLSLGCLSATLLLTLFFNPKAQERTIIEGIYRYAMCTPFFMVFIQYVTGRLSFKRWHFLMAFIAGNLVLFLFKSYFDIGTFLYFNISIAAVLLYMVYANQHRWAGIVLVIFGLAAQALLFQDFLTALHYPD